MQEDELQAASQEAEQPPSLWQQLRRLFSRDERLHRLNWAIMAYPDAPGNYILRGELLLNRGEADQAAQDFLRALELASEQVETEDWGVVAQVLQDRARLGLRDALQRAARYNANTEHIDDN